MKKLLNILLRYYAFWITFSILMRAGFLFYNHEQTAEFSSTEIIKTFLYGIKLDLCMSAYFLLIPLLLLTFSFLIKKSILKTILNIYTFLLILISSWISIIDFELYRNWGFRMDKTLLLYLKTPGEAFASTETWITVLFLASILIVTLALFFAYRKLIINSIDVCNLKSTKNSLWLLLALPLLILPIRGGFGVATLNTSAVYFHTAPFVNHAAINVVWNVGYSLSTNENAKAYQFFNNEKANLIFDGLQKENGNTSRMLNTSRPNIIIIILESFSARIIEPLGGEAGVCPNFNRFCSEGVLFDHFYANGDRSDKGLACIISSYPAQPTSSIIKFPEKTTNLPFLNTELAKAGYVSAFYYGGDLNFANMKSYFVNGGFNEIITIDDFPKKLNSGKWGVHDEHVFSKLLTDMDNSEQPFLKVMFSLSSHEPFEVPIKAVFTEDDEDSRFLNSAFYTDKCLGDFIAQAKATSWWNNSLVVLLADHGGRLPRDLKLYEEEKFKIPMLWLGGALNCSDTIVNTYSSQIDVSKTLLGQLELDARAFEFGKDIFAFSLENFAFFVFNDGFGFTDSSFTFIHDNIGDTTIFSEGNISNKNKNKGKAFLQVLSENFRNK